MFSFNPSQFKLWLSGFLALGVVSASVPPVTAASLTREQPTSSLPASAVSLDFGDLLRNTVRYIQVSNISNEEEVAIGEQINDRLLSERYQLYQNAQVNQYVDQLGQQLVQNSDRRDIPYTFQVVVSDEINAFATPGGFIYVTTGLLQAADNEAQLASVLAHEIAHVNERHSVEAMKEAVIAQGIAETAGLDTSTLAQIGYQLAIDLPRSRSYEYEADNIGLDILQRAGYAPIAFVQFFEKLQGRDATPEFLRTHPTSENRIEAISEMIESGEASTGKGLNEAAYQQNVLSLL